MNFHPRAHTGLIGMVVACVAALSLAAAPPVPPVPSVPPGAPGGPGAPVPDPAKSPAKIDATTVTIHQDSITLADALAAIKKQTGNTVIDLRARYGQPAAAAPFALHLDKLPF